MNQKHVVLVHPKKKSRSANFSSGEKTLLLSLINEFKGVIENKKTDAATLEEKTNAWWQVTERFNSESPNMIPRSLDSLKKFYTNKKKDLRKRAADERKTHILTGGKSCQLTATDKEDDLLLSIIGAKSIYELQNSLDEHNILSNNAQVPIAITEKDNFGEDLEAENSVPVYVVTNAGNRTAAGRNTNGESSSALLYMVDGVQQPPVVIDTVAGPSTSSSLTSSSKENVLKTEDVNVGNLIMLKNYNPKILQKPTSTPLQKESKGAVADPNRRRSSPVVKALTSSLMAEMLNSLLDKRSAIADYTKQYLEEKVARKRREAALKEELLQLDIAIKKEQLKKLQGTSSK